MLRIPEFSPTRRPATLCGGLLLTAGIAAAQSSTIYDFPGHTAGEQYGESLTSTPDLDGDGWDDLLIASPKGAGGKGYVKAISGRTGVELYVLKGAVVGGSFGQALSSLSDLDGDGRAEVIIGSPLASGLAPESGIVQVFSGATGTAMWTLSGDSAQDHFGWAVAGLADVSGDGTCDFAVGAIDDDNSGNSSGSVRLFSGATGAKLFDLDGNAPTQLFGFDVVALDDWNGDNVPDLAVGAPYFANSAQAGFVRIHSGKDGQTIRQIDGSSAADRFGASLANIGDVDGDGVDDLAVGAPQPTGGKRGYVEVHLAAGGFPLLSMGGDSPNDYFGSAVAAAGDADDDGYVDIAVGAPGDDDRGQDSGSVRLLSTWQQVEISTTHGDSAGVKMGSALSALGDVNADGKPEVVAACRGASTYGPNAGCARVLSTSPLGLSSDSHLISLSNMGGRSLTVDFTPLMAGNSYLVLGSVSGTSPGTTFGSLNVPLNRDRYYKFTRAFPNSALLQNSSGALDARGKAVAVFSPPVMTLSPSYLGLTFQHAAIAYAPGIVAVDVSNVVPVTLVP
jgi:hypothetical protein